MDSKNLTVQTSQAPIAFSDLERMAGAFAKSGLFGIKNSDQAIALMLIAQAEGLHPAVAARDYHVIQGRPALKADAMLARFQAAGGKVVWNAYTDAAVSGTFSHPAGGSATVEWTLKQAQTAGLTGKDVWRQYPRAMLRARVISEGIRTVYPGVSVGVYTPEELADFDAKPATREVESVQVQEPALTPEPKKEGKIKSEKLPDFEPASFDRKAAFAGLKASGWAPHDLKVYAQEAFGVINSKDLSDDQLKLMLAVVSSSSFEVAIKEVAPEYEIDVP